MKLNCIIVEDEPLAAEILAEYVAETPFLHLVEVCPDAIKALEVVQNQAIDVVFLDINLPKLSGMEFIKTLRRQPKIILTTAHHEFAVEAFGLQVVDYLLKPIEFARFTQAVQKLVQPPKPGAAILQNSGTAEVRPYYFFTVNKRSVKIYLDEILFIESLKDSVSIQTKEKAYHTHYQLGELEALIRSDNFLRIHRSFLVAVDKLASFSATEVEVGGRGLPIGRSYKGWVMERLGR